MYICRNNNKTKNKVAISGIEPITRPANLGHTRLWKNSALHHHIFHQLIFFLTYQSRRCSLEFSTNLIREEKTSFAQNTFHFIYLFFCLFVSPPPLVLSIFYESLDKILEEQNHFLNIFCLIITHHKNSVAIQALYMCLGISAYMGAWAESKH